MTEFLQHIVFSLTERQKISKKKKTEGEKSLSVSLIADAFLRAAFCLSGVRTDSDGLIGVPSTL